MTELRPQIRIATIADAAVVAQLAEQTFRETFAATNSAADMALHCARQYGESIQAAEIANPDWTTCLCELAGEAVGYAQVRSGLAPPCVQARSPGEIYRLYVSGDWQGRGVAQLLMKSCLERLAGADRVWLGVWEHNPRAIAFYSKFGFVVVGDHVYTVGNDPQRDLVMVRESDPDL